MGLFSTKIATKEMVPLCRNIATSYEAGIPIINGLTLAGGSARNKTVQEVTRTMAEDIQGGATLGEAAAVHEKRLPAYFIHLVNAGDSGGRLDAMLRDLAEYYENQLKIRRGIIRGLIYPGIQLTMAWFLGTFAFRLIGRLDFASTARFQLDDFFLDYAVFQGIALGLFGVLILVCALLSRVGVFKWIWGWVTNYVWPLKPVARKFALARFFRSMSLLIGSGLGIKQCIQRSADTTVNPYIQRDLVKAIPIVADGGTLVQAFSVCRTLTPTAREMLLVGEQSGDLDVALKKVSDYHLEEANHAVSVAGRFMGIMILLAVGGLIGYLVISFYANYYGKMFEAVGL